ncbi:hypothetical protein KIPB_011808, partial [Kipferlia bialata]
GVVAAAFCTRHMYRGSYQGRFYESFVSERCTTTTTLVAAVVALIGIVPHLQDIGILEVFRAELNKHLISLVSTLIQLVINIIFTGR